MMKLISIIALLTACGDTTEEGATTNTTGSTTSTTSTSVTGTGDSYSDMACESYGISEVDVQLVSNESDAASVVFVPYNNTNSALVRMPESGDGYMVIEIGDWMTWLRIFTEEEVSYTIVGGDDHGRDTNLSCPTSGMTDHLMAFHEWDFYTIKFDASSPSEFWLRADKQEE